MRYFVFGFIGTLIGFSMGFLVRSLLYVVASKNKKMKCNYVEKYNHIASSDYQICPGQASNVCLEGLCPVHCNTLHQGSCTGNYFSTESREPAKVRG